MGLNLPQLGQSVWRASELGASADQALSTGHAQLDAQLPAGGWPAGALSEILQPAGSHQEWQLLLPGLRLLTQASRGAIMLMGAPHTPFGPGLWGQGLDASRLLWIQARAGPERLWSCEQALRCAEVLAVLAWLPQVRSEHLRRLQWAAQSQGKFLFAMRPELVRGESSPAPLRLVLDRASCASLHGMPSLRLQILKRRGPPLAQTLVLPARPARLMALLALQHSHDTPDLLSQELAHAVARLATAA